MPVAGAGGRLAHARMKPTAAAERLFLLPGAVRRSAEIDAWFAHRALLGAMAREWFGRMRRCGPDVHELLHDGHPTACVNAAAFGYTNVFAAHVNVGFFHGASLPDPAGLLQGNGRFMRHVKLKPSIEFDRDALEALVTAAYRDVSVRLTKAQA
jgi:hypothetical protein